MIEAANKSAEQLRQELRQKAEEESSERSTARERRSRPSATPRSAPCGTRSPDWSSMATEKVIGETLDDSKHRQLIEQGNPGGGEWRRPRLSAMRVPSSSWPRSKATSRNGKNALARVRDLMSDPEVAARPDQPDDRHRAANGARIRRAARVRRGGHQPRQAAHRVEPRPRRGGDRRRVPAARRRGRGAGTRHSHDGDRAHRQRIAIASPTSYRSAWARTSVLERRSSIPASSAV